MTAQVYGQISIDLYKTSLAHTQLLLFSHLSTGVRLHSVLPPPLHPSHVLSRFVYISLFLGLSSTIDMHQSRTSPLIKHHPTYSLLVCEHLRFSFYPFLRLILPFLSESRSPITLKAGCRREDAQSMAPLIGLVTLCERTRRVVILYLAFGHLPYP